MSELVVGGQPVADAALEAQRVRIARRYRAEARFKAYGIGAIVFAAVFLVVLLADIFVKAMPAFTTNYVRLEVTPTAEALDISGSVDAEALRTANYAKPLQASLTRLFPSAAEERRSRQALFGLLSSGADIGLRERLTNDPALVGQTFEVDALLSDDADLFLKGDMTDVERSPGAGTLTPSATSGDLTVTSTASEFTDEIAAVKLGLAAEARALRAESSRIAPALAARSAALRRAETALASARANSAAPAAITRLEAELERVRGEHDSLAGIVDQQKATADELERRSQDSAAAETLEPTMPSLLVELNGGLVKLTRISADRAEGTTIMPLSSASPAAPGTWNIVTYSRPEANRKLADNEIAWLDKLQRDGVSESAFNWRFFTGGDSREAELAGILGALVGSAFTMLVTLLICLPVGVAAAIYLEEFAPKNRITDVIEVNINNLAAVPSIVFGLLGLAVFLNFFGMPRSAPLVGGLVLALLVLPTIIIASRAALKAVPPSIREAALGVGASHQQAVFHHVLPLAMPGVLTGTIIGMAHALGETAPLLLIGMVAFIVDVPGGVTQAATVLPVQIFLWSDLPELGFQAKTAAAIVVLLLFLFVMNGLAIILRRRFERRW